MKFNCGPTPEQKEADRLHRLTNWHPFFVMWPRRLGEGDCRWLETIERRGRYLLGFDGPEDWRWEYRAP